MPSIVQLFVVVEKEQIILEIQFYLRYSFKHVTMLDRKTKEAFLNIFETCNDARLENQGSLFRAGVILVYLLVFIAMHDALFWIHLSPPLQQVANCINGNDL